MVSVALLIVFCVLNLGLVISNAKMSDGNGIMLLCSYAAFCECADTDVRLDHIHFVQVNYCLVENIVSTLSLQIGNFLYII